jgi:spectinomycin phosphotransferase/16S rRNA (guanine(1405)-N(7))-methyltransferase
VSPASLEYRPVGFGSHHWDVVDRNGSRWFATVDQLDQLQRSFSEPDGAAFERLRAALGTAVTLRGRGCDFVVAPVPTPDGVPVVRIDRRFALSLYPYVDGEHYASGGFATAVHRRGVLDLIVSLHRVPTEASPETLADEFAIPHRDELVLSLRPDDVPTIGPYAARAADLMLANAITIQRQLARYDRLVVETQRTSRPMVLTHGEPHAGNTILTPDGWMLIDWDTVAVAPPERDLWSLDPGDHSILDAYREATGTLPLWSTLDLYRLRWDLADIAVYVSRFRGEHIGDADDDKSWDELQSLVSSLPAE